MASLASLQSNLNYWNGQANQQNDKIKQLKRRRADVENVKKALKSTSSGNAAGVNDKIHASQGKLGGGIEYTGKNAQIHSVLAGKAEGSLGADSNLTSADDELQKELNSIDNKIGEAENALASAKRKAAETKSAITAEEKRQREEKAKAASGSGGSSSGGGSSRSF